VAHRGESYLAPENTMAAIELAWEYNDDAVEIDVHLTRDGRLVLSHDADMSRTCGEKLSIRDCSFAQLQKLDAGAWKDKRFSGIRMPALEDVVASVPTGKRLFVEVKCGVEAIGELARVIEASGKSDEQMVIISFRADVVESAKKRLPGIKAFYLADFKEDKTGGTWSPGASELIESAKRMGADGLDLCAARPCVDFEFVRAVHEAGLEFSAWTIDEPVLARRLVEFGVDSITTNRAKWMREQLGYC